MQTPTHFELFGLEPRFALDPAALERAYRDIQARVHPDRFARAGDAERRLSMQWTTQVNEAYRVLRRPLERAAYLLQLNGVDPGFETDTAMPPEFLARQMHLREALEAASGDAPALARLRAELRAELRGAESILAQQLDAARDYAGAAALLRELMFLHKLDAQIDRALEALEA